MSFRLFIYYCAIGGGCAAYVGWALGRLPSIGDDQVILREAVRGLFLGMIVALTLALIDALWNGSTQVGTIFQRVGVAVVVGCLGGFLGGFIGQVFYGWTEAVVFLLFGWIITGLLIGAAPGVFDFLGSLMRDEDTRGPRRKVLRGVIGGAVGGLLGAALYLVINSALLALFKGKEGNFWSPSAWGMVALGMCIGLLIALAQVILSEAWLRVDQGFRAGRELILSKAEVTIGRAESCDLGLFGDPTVEKLHARILQKGDRYLIDDNRTQAGTFLNGQRVDGPTPLRSGDEIRVGRCVLRFGERQKRPA
jgi:hypothetical protein